MDIKELPEFKAGDALSAGKLMAVRDRVQRQRITTGQNSGVVLTESTTGTAIRIQFPANRYVGVTVTPGISVRVGTAPGTGMVQLVTYSDDLGVWVDSGIAVDVLYFSALPVGGIATDKYCWVEQDTDGNYVIVSVEC